MTNPPNLADALETVRAADYCVLTKSEVMGIIGYIGALASLWVAHNMTPVPSAEEEAGMTALMREAGNKSG